MNTNNIPSRIKQRYFRKVIAYPDGAIVHDGDCLIDSETPVCDCGLLHDLMPMIEEAEIIYPQFYEDIEKQNIFLAFATKSLRDIENG